MFEFEHTSLSSSRSLRSSLCPSSSYVSPGYLERLWARSLFSGHVTCICGYASDLKLRSPAKLSLFFLSFFFFDYCRTHRPHLFFSSSTCWCRYVPLHSFSFPAPSLCFIRLCSESLFLATPLVDRLASTSYVLPQSLYFPGNTPHMTLAYSDLPEQAISIDGKHPVTRRRLVLLDLSKGFE